MKKLVLLIIVFLLVGCTNNKEFSLTEKYYNKGELISITADEITSNESFILYTYNNFCSLPIHCENIFKEVFEKNKIDALSIPFDEFKNTTFYQEVKFAPSIILIKDGIIVTYLKADSDKDYDKYQNVDEFEKWLQKYIVLNKEKSE